MRTVATFDHGKQQWCVQTVECGPSPIVCYLQDENQAIKLSEGVNKNDANAIMLLGQTIMANLANDYPATVLHIEPL